MNTKHILKSFKQPFVGILIGCPLSGKSTIIKEWSNQGIEFEIISRDVILLEQSEYTNYSEAYDNADQKNIDDILKTKMKYANDNKKNVIIDMTHMGSKRRKYNLSFFDKNYFKVAIYMPDIKLEELFERNKKRNIEENKFLKEELIISMKNSFAPISEKEGFNKIIQL